MKVNALLLVRRIHLYLGVFIAPSVLFFALTGALQTFSLHESSRGSTYQPPEWTVMLAQVHKKQTTQLPQRRGRPQEAARGLSQGEKASPAAATPAANSPRSTHHPLPLKIFFLLVSIGLFLSTFSGVYMAFRYRRAPRVIVAVLAAGIVIPLILTLI